MNNTTNMNYTTDVNTNNDNWIKVQQDKYYSQIKKNIDTMEKDGENNPFSYFELEKQLLDVGNLEKNSCGPKDCPVVYFNRFYEDYAECEIKNQNSDDLEKLIQTIIIKGKFRNREQLMSYWGGIPYKVRTNGECMEVVPWSSYGELTRIQPIRLIEKIESCARNKKSRKIKVACFGQLYGDTSILAACLAERQIEISIMEFMPQEKEQTFLCNDRLYDFGNYEDMLDVVNTYDLIIMTDNAHYYRRFQSIKAEEENHCAEYVNFYCDMAQKTEDVWDKNMYYYLMFKSAVDYVADKNSKMSAKFEFDEQILNRWKIVLATVEKKPDVYCYISENNIIANEDISSNNVCKDECYDGKNLIVYKLSEYREEFYKYDEQIMNDNENNYVLIDMWKFIKSIGNDFYEKFNHITSGKEWSINQWRSCKLLLDLDHVGREGSKIVIAYDFICDDNEMVLCAKKLFVCMLKLMSESRFSCVKSYLRNLISDTVMARSDSVKGIVFAYLLKNRLDVEFVYRSLQKQLVNAENHMDYRFKKTVYVILEKLNQTIIRNVDFKEMILFTEFRLKYASNISEEQFQQYLRLIHEACEEFGDTFSRIYNYSDVN